MTNTDKTRQKLVDSMRKTKAETETETKAEADIKAETETPPPQASAPKAKKTRARRASTKPAGDARSVSAKPSTRFAKPAQTPSDPYQGARRVWPD